MIIFQHKCCSNFKHTSSDALCRRLLLVSGLFFSSAAPLLLSTAAFVSSNPLHLCEPLTISRTLWRFTSWCIFSRIVPIDLCFTNKNRRLRQTDMYGMFLCGRYFKAKYSLFLRWNLYISIYRLEWRKPHFELSAVLKLKFKQPHWLQTSAGWSRYEKWIDGNPAGSSVCCGVLVR